VKAIQKRVNDFTTLLQRTREEEKVNSKMKLAALQESDISRLHEYKKT